MFRTITILLTGLMLAFAPAGADSWAGSAKKTVTEVQKPAPPPPPSLTIQPSVKKPPPAPPSKLKIKKVVLYPNLKIDKVWLDTSCQLKVRIKNAGAVKLSTKAHKNIRVKVVCGKNTSTFWASKFDLKAKLRSPGGKAAIATGYRILGDQPVKVAVGLSKAPGEIFTSDNSFSKDMKGTCKITVVQLPSSATVTEAAPPLEAGGGAPASPPGGLTLTHQPGTTSSKLPRKITSPLPAPGSGGSVLDMHRKTPSLTLKKTTPPAMHKLKKSPKTPPTMHKLDKAPKIPPALAMKKPLKKAPGQAASSSMMKAPARARAMTAASELSAVMIYSPQSGETYHTGDSLTLAMRITRYIPEGPMSIVLVEDTLGYEVDRHTTYWVPPEGSEDSEVALDIRRTYSLIVPEPMRDSMYHFSVSLGGEYYRSRSFRMASGVDGDMFVSHRDIRIVTPRGGETWSVCGSSHEETIVYKLIGEYSGNPPVTLILLKGSEEVHRWTGFTATPGPRDTFSARLTVPSGLEIGADYRIRAEWGPVETAGGGLTISWDPVSGESRSFFTIQSGIEVLGIHATSYNATRRANIRWRASCATGRVKISLLRGGEQVHVINSQVNAEEGEAGYGGYWFGSNHFTGGRYSGPSYSASRFAGTGSGFQVKVEPVYESTTPMAGISQTFSVTVPSIEVHNEVVSPGGLARDLVRVRWSAPDVNPDATVSVRVHWWAVDSTDCYYSGGRSYVTQGRPTAGSYDWRPDDHHCRPWWVRFSVEVDGWNDLISNEADTTVQLR